jgi:hypothetical protein
VAKLKDKVLEIAEIATECPENLQAICFELLLRHHLDSISPKPGKPAVQEAADPKLPAEEKKRTVEEWAPSQDDLAETDLHVKVRHFMKKYALSIEELSNLFYKENDEVRPLYEDLKTTRMAEGQIRIALLQALHSAISSGDFEAEVERVRAECKDRKCYDQNNFGQNFTNNAVLFDFDKYAKSIKAFKLSEDGRKELSAVAKELQ